MSCNLAVMTAHGRGAFSRVWLGSTADSFVQHGSEPTPLLQPAHTHPDTPAEPATSTELRRILVPLDGSKLAEQVLEPARELGALFGTEYWLLRVAEPFKYDGYVPPRDAPTLEPDLIHVLTRPIPTFGTWPQSCAAWDAWRPVWLRHIGRLQRFWTRLSTTTAT